MDIVDFLPKYPNVNNSEYDDLNPYKADFYQVLFDKKEFRDNKLSEFETFPKEKAQQTKYQKTIVRYLSSHTPYEKVILVHSMGLGKTCSAIGAIEQIKAENSSLNGALVLAKGEQILNNFINELVYKCTSGYYIPINNKSLTELQRVRRVKKMISYYEFNTFAKFAGKLEEYSNEYIINHYSNKIIVVDEAHNLRIQKEDTDLKTYQQFHRFLHIVQNCKILFLSGTPMKDGPEELASLTNLLLPMSNQFPVGDEFLSTYMMKQGESYVVRKDKAVEMKHKLKGVISFLRETESTVKRVYMGEKLGQLKHLTVYPNQMSEFQSGHYISAYNKDKGNKQDGLPDDEQDDYKGGIYNNSRDASLFVYPDGSYGSAGFKKYIKETNVLIKKNKKSSMTYNLDGKFRAELQQGNLLDNVKKYSTLYANLIEKINNTNGNCFVFSSAVKGSGAILFCLLLQLFGYGSFKYDPALKPASRYALITSETSKKEIEYILKVYNSKENKHGQLLKVIVGSRSVMEGFSFNNVVLISINTPHWNYSETAQAIGRGIRFGSHKDLGGDVRVEILQNVSIPINGLSIDLYLYEMSEIKDISIRSILRILMECAFDCGLNYLRNKSKGEDYSRECDYTICDFQCDGIESYNNDVDISTYQLYYTDSLASKVKRRIETLLRQNTQMTLQAIVDNLNTEFTEEEIYNTLNIIEEDVNPVFTYKDFLLAFSRYPIDEIKLRIDDIFKQLFIIDLPKLLKLLSQYTPFQVLLSLSDMIDKNIPITNKYGITSYLRENNNYYFLVDRIDSSNNIYNNYYCEYINIITNQTADQIFEQEEKNVLPKIISDMLTSEVKFKDNISKIPIIVQELLLELAVKAKKKGVPSVGRDIILSNLASYIEQYGDVTVSTLLYKKQNGLLKCYVDGDWDICDNDIVSEFKQSKEKAMKDLIDSKYNYSGKINKTVDPEVFCIVDLEKQRENRDNTDKRKIYYGKNCRAGWKISELQDVALNKLGIDPSDFGKKTGVGGDVSKYDFVDKNNVDPDYIRRARLIADYRIDGICNLIEKWMAQRGLVQEDENCGKKKTNPEESKSKSSIKSAVIELNNEELFDDNKSFIKTVWVDTYGADKSQKFKNLKQFADDYKTGVFISTIGKQKAFLACCQEIDGVVYIVKLLFNKNHRDKIDKCQQSISVLNQALINRYNRAVDIRVDTNIEADKGMISYYKQLGYTKEIIRSNITYLSFNK